jgi:hypothetical protein
MTQTCQRCGACCAAALYIVTGTNARVRPGHLADFDPYEPDGVLIRRRKPWSRGHAVCIFLRRGTGCPLHGTPEQPADCAAFHCWDPPFADDPMYAAFRAFRQRWLATGMDRIARGDPPA